MGDRDDLAAIIADDDNFDHDPDADAWFINKLRAADAVLAAGWTRPKTVTTVEELEALPDQTVIRCDGGWPEVFEVYKGQWQTPGSELGGPSSTVPLPATVLFQPVP